MRRLFRHRPSPAMLVAVLALIIALGGTSYAAIKLPANSVGTRQLKANAVVSSKIKDGTLTAKDFAKGQLAVGSAGPQGVPGTQGPAGPAGAPGPQGDPGVVPSVFVDAVTSGAPASGTQTAICFPGEIATGGGAVSTDGVVTQSEPVLSGGFPVGWRATAAPSTMGGTATVVAWAVCVGL
jgi:hypothetical protein